ncbi:MAG: hypothetical protein LBP58_11170 [Azoarcus sp.]|jgi:hypothetical protein|nr:hypothetical protein [Azoarcus sp.]
MSARTPSRFLACLFLTVTAMPSAAVNDGDAPSASDVRIEALRGKAERLRDEADAAYQTAEAACYKRFLVNRCIDKAKGERLIVVRQARALEAEAHRIDLAERNRAAAEAARKAEEQSVPRSTAAANPAADVATPTMRTGNADIQKTIVRQSASAQKSRERASARKRANVRAQTARRDRERYDARIQELEEKKARDADGR